MNVIIFSIFAGLALTGCVSETMSLKLSESHPAHPEAPKSPEAIATPMLMAGSQGLVLPVSTNQAEMQHGQHQHAPSAKSVPKPAEHKHDEHAAPAQQTPAQGAVYTCPHHPEVKQNKPGECSKCGMKLEMKK